MGTRGLTCVVKGGKFRVAQYGQWDHYPDGQGKDILDFLTQRVANNELDKFSSQIDKCRFGSEDEISKAYEGFTDKNGWMTLEQSNAFKESKYAYLSRDTGAGILNTVLDNQDNELLLQDSSEFAADSLFCEWAYVVDLDKNTFEVYKGFQKEPVPDDQRFAGLNAQTRVPVKLANGKKKVSKYYPVHLLSSYFLDELPSYEEFIKDTSDEDADDEDIDGQ